MPGLFTRWTADDDSKLTVHKFGALFGEVIRGNLTIADMETELTLDPLEVTQTTEALAFSGTGSPVKQAQYILQQQDVQILCEDGYYDMTTAYALLGITTMDE